MRTAAELIEEAKFNTNNVNSNRFNDAAMIRFLNTAIRTVQKTIFNSNPTSDTFTKEKTFDYVNNVINQEYALPSDIFAENAVVSVIPLDLSDRPREALPKIIEKERLYKTGYFMKAKGKWGVTQNAAGTNVSKLKMVYVQRIPQITATSDTPQLPEVTEDMLVRIMERLIFYVDSSADKRNADLLTAEEKTELSELFANTTKDIIYPPVTDETYITY